MPPSRVLAWEGCVNVRDLGGLPTEDGRETRFRAVVRADNITGLSDDGWRALADYGVRRVVDLRSADERDADPPHDTRVEVVHVQLLDPPGLREIDTRLAGVTDPVEWRRQSYLYFLERYRQNIARAVASVAEPGEGTLLVHCAGGVDRTGLVAAAILRVAGVSVQTIAADYAESEASWAPSVEQWVDAAADEDERRKRRLLSVMPARAMAAVLGELERQHGSVEAYLRSGGVTAEQLERVRALLVA